jgi:hypothetical protein
MCRVDLRSRVDCKSSQAFFRAVPSFSKRFNQPGVLGQEEDFRQFDISHFPFQAVSRLFRLNRLHSAVSKTNDLFGFQPGRALERNAGLLDRLIKASHPVGKVIRLISSISACVRPRKVYEGSARAVGWRRRVSFAGKAPGHEAVSRGAKFPPRRFNRAISRINAMLRAGPIRNLCIRRRVNHQ